MYEYVEQQKLTIYDNMCIVQLICNSTAHMNYMSSF